MKFLLVLSFLAYASATIQEVILYESNIDNVGNSFTFRTQVPDLTIYPFLPNIKRICHNTRIELYTNINFEGDVDGQHSSSGCHDFVSGKYKSFRFFGNVDSSLDGVSLFPEPDLRGEETYVDHSPFGQVTQRISSVAYSGSSSWTIFDKVNFEGNSSCLPSAGIESNTVVYVKLDGLNISDIGSLYKNCDRNPSPQKRAEMRILAHQLKK